MAQYVEPEPLATVPRPVETGRSNPGYGSEMSSELSKKEKIRVQFEFVPEALARLDALKEVTGAPTRAETVRSALRFFEWLVNIAMRGNTIVILDKNNEVVSRIPAEFLMR